MTGFHRPTRRGKLYALHIRYTLTHKLKDKLETSAASQIKKVTATWDGLETVDTCQVTGISTFALLVFLFHLLDFADGRGFTGYEAREVISQ